MILLSNTHLFESDYKFHTFMLTVYLSYFLSFFFHSFSRHQDSSTKKSHPVFCNLCQNVDHQVSLSIAPKKEFLSIFFSSLSSSLVLSHVVIHMLE